MSAVIRTGLIGSLQVRARGIGDLCATVIELYPGTGRRTST